MSVVSGIFAADAAGDAADTQADAAEKSGNTQAEAMLEATKLSNASRMEMFNKGNEYTKPWRDAGEFGLAGIEDALMAGPKDLPARAGYTPTGIPDKFSQTKDQFGVQDRFSGTLDRGGPFNFEADPGYQFRQDEARRAIEHGASARGDVLSGNTLKAVGDRAQQIASDEYDRAKGRYDQDRATAGAEFYADKADAIGDRGRQMAEYYTDKSVADADRQNALAEFYTQKGVQDTDRSNTLAEYYQSIQPYQSLAGVGQTSAGQAQNAAGAAGADIANNLYSGTAGAGGANAAAQWAAGQANAAGGINQANAISGITEPVKDIATAWAVGKVV